MYTYVYMSRSWKSAASPLNILTLLTPMRIRLLWAIWTSPCDSSIPSTRQKEKCARVSSAPPLPHPKSITASVALMGKDRNTRDRSGPPEPTWAHARSGGRPSAETLTCPRSMPRNFIAVIYQANRHLPVQQSLIAYLRPVRVMTVDRICNRRHRSGRTRSEPPDREDACRPAELKVCIA